MENDTSFTSTESFDDSLRALSISDDQILEVNDNHGHVLADLAANDIGAQVCLRMFSWNPQGKNFQGSSRVRHELMRQFLEQVTPDCLFLQESPWVPKNLKKRIEYKVNDRNFSVCGSNLLKKEACIFFDETRLDLREVVELLPHIPDRNPFANTIRTRCLVVCFRERRSQSDFLAASVHSPHKLTRRDKRDFTKSLFDSLQHLQHARQVPLLLCGDFNFYILNRHGEPMFPGLMTCEVEEEASASRIDRIDWVCGLGLNTISPPRFSGLREVPIMPILGESNLIPKDHPFSRTAIDNIRSKAPRVSCSKFNKVSDHNPMYFQLFF